MSRLAWALAAALVGAAADCRADDRPSTFGPARDVEIEYKTNTDSQISQMLLRESMAGFYWKQSGFSMAAD